MSLRTLIIDSIMQSQRVKYFTTSKNHLRIRCPFCNDSVKKNNSAHLYIKVDSEEAFPYFCQRCNHSGYVNKSFLSKIGVHNDGLGLVLDKVNKKAIGKNNKLLKRRIEFPKLEANSSVRKSVLYLRNRFDMHKLKGTQLQNEFKFILDVNSFLDYNKISRNEDFSDFVGFLSYDNTHLNLRNTSNEGVRYKILKIIDEESTSKIYFKPAVIDAMKEVKVFITEGVMDLFGLYHYLLKEEIELTNALFIAVNGKGYKFIDDVLVQKGVLSCRFYFALDNDVSNEFLKDIVLGTRLMKKRKSIIIRNNFQNEKDFGTSTDNIFIRNLNDLRG